MWHKKDMREGRCGRGRAEINQGPDKYCPKCKNVKPRSKFQTDRSRTDQLCGYCSDCNTKRSKAYQMKLKDDLTRIY